MFLLELDYRNARLNEVFLRNNAEKSYDSFRSVKYGLWIELIEKMTIYTGLNP